MPSYVITGASRGLGAEFLKNISSNPSNTVIGLVRNVTETEASIASWKTPNVHVIRGDMNDYESLKKAAEATAAITSGTLDYLIANAGMICGQTDEYDPFSVLGQDARQLTDELVLTFQTNVIGNIHLFNLFMPLVLKGTVKKVITISTGLADVDLTIKYSVHENGPYSVSKSAMNMVTAKFQAEYQKDGVLFISMSPGMVETGRVPQRSEEEIQKAMAMGAKFMQYAPHFTGPAQPEDSVRDMLKVIENVSLANGDAGAFISHLGTKQWL